MKRKAQMLLLTAAMIFGAGAVYAFAEEDDHNHSGGGGECGNMLNFKHATLEKYRHGGAGVAPPAGFLPGTTVFNRSQAGDSRDYYEKAEYWAFHNECDS